MVTNNSSNYQPTQFSVQTGGANGSLNNIAPSATLGIPLVSNGVSAQPLFSTALVAGGGTGRTSCTAYSVICGGTTSTNPLQSVSGVGTSAQVLTSNGAGVLPTWQNSSGGFSVNTQVFTASGTYTPTTGMLYCTIEVVGGGGGGGGIAAPDATTVIVGGGGGAGGYSRMTVSAATIGASQTVTIGAGGAGGTTSGTNGSTGGTSSVGSLLSASGGVGGTGEPVSFQGIYSSGGIGGIGSSGDINCNGEPGQGGWGIFNSSTSLEVAVGGAGGNSFFGGGAIFTGSSTAINSSAGSSGLAYGGGGGGAYSTNSGSAHAGGAGSSGIVVITEYI